MTPLKSAIVAFVITLVGVLGSAFLFADIHGPGSYQRGQMLGSGAVRLSFAVALVVFFVVRIFKGPARPD
jgi:hypothetical protein